MNHLSIFSIVVLLTTFSSCEKHKPANSIEQTKINWDRISIKLANQYLDIPSNGNSIYCNKWDFKDTIIFNKHMDTRTNEVESTVLISPSEKDSLYKIAMEIIITPTFASKDETVTCFAGKGMEISIESNGTILSCRYSSSIEDWTTVSASTKKLYHLISKKVSIK